jgi:hypothetical protein
MPTFVSTSIASLARSVALLLAVAVVLTGCDSNGGEDDSSATVSPAESAEAIAFSTAEETGGTLDDVENAISAFNDDLSSANSASKALSASRECTFDDDAVLYTCTVEVSGSSPRVSSASFDRTYRFQFFDGETAVRRSPEADSMTAELVSGSGSLQTARIDNSHEVLPATWSIARTATADEYAVRLLSQEAGRNVEENFTGPVRERSRTASVRKTIADDLLWRSGDGFVDGRIDGVYNATVEILRADDTTVSRSVDAEYTIEFGESESVITFTGGGETFAGESFTFNSDTGEME